MSKQGLFQHKLFSQLRDFMIRHEEQGRTGSILFWRQYIFVMLMSTITLLGPFVLIPSARLFIEEDMAAVGIATVIIFLAMVFFAFARNIRYRIRFTVIAWIFYGMSILVFTFTGPKGSGLAYIACSCILLQLYTEKPNSRLILSVNILVYIALSFLFYLGKDLNLNLHAFGKYWPIIVSNSLIVTIFIIQMQSLILKGMDRRFRKAEFVNGQLVEAQQMNVRQIELLNSLRQSGVLMMDTRLSLEERLNMSLTTIQKKLNACAIGLSLAQRGSDTALCISSSSEKLLERRIPIPEITGPYLILSSEEIRSRDDQTDLMKITGPGQIYFAGHFFTTQSIGVLEIILLQDDDICSCCLNFIQTSLFQLSATLTNDQLIKGIKQSRDILEASYDEVLQAWARILELRDIETKGHSTRVVNLCLNLADKAGLSEDEKLQLQRGAFLHDIGKLGIPDSILKKEGPLSDEEWALMRRHPEIGRDSVGNIPFLRPAVPVIYHHHERWDGKGYPEGLGGHDIPLAARIFMIADVYDALISDRPYRKAMSREEIVKYMISEREVFFDPELLDLFLEDVDSMVRDRANDEILFSSKLFSDIG